MVESLEIPIKDLAVLVVFKKRWEFESKNIKTGHEYISEQNGCGFWQLSGIWNFLELVIDRCNQCVCTKRFSYGNAHNKDLQTKMEARKFTKEIVYLHEKKCWRELLRHAEIWAFHRKTKYIFLFGFITASDLGKVLFLRFLELPRMSLPKEESRSL